MWSILWAGNFCEFAVTVPTPCPRGTYMPYGADGFGNVTGQGRILFSFCMILEGLHICFILCTKNLSYSFGTSQMT